MKEDLVREWHPTENNRNKPWNIRLGSDKSITWKCEECGHVWEP